MIRRPSTQIDAINSEQAARKSEAGGSRQRRLAGYDTDVSLILEPAVKFLITLDRDEDGVWIAECPSIPGCVSQGKAKDEAIANVRAAIALCLEVRAERGMPLTVETHEVEVTA